MRAVTDAGDHPSHYRRMCVDAARRRLSFMATAVGCWDCTRLFSERVTSAICEGLRVSMPPLLRNVGGDALCTPSRLLPQVSRGLALRGAAVCASMQDAVNWCVHRTPEKSEAAVQLALLRERIAAAVVPAPARTHPTWKDVWGAHSTVEADECVTRFAAPPRWEVPSTALYS